MTSWCLQTKVLTTSRQWPKYSISQASPTCIASRKNTNFCGPRLSTLDWSYDTTKYRWNQSSWKQWPSGLHQVTSTHFRNLLVFWTSTKYLLNTSHWPPAYSTTWQRQEPFWPGAGSVMRPSHWHPLWRFPTPTNIFYSNAAAQILLLVMFYPNGVKRTVNYTLWPVSSSHWSRRRELQDPLQRATGNFFFRQGMKTLLRRKTKPNQLHVIIDTKHHNLESFMKIKQKH